MNDITKSKLNAMLWFISIVILGLHVHVNKTFLACLLYEPIELNRIVVLS